MYNHWDFSHQLMFDIKRHGKPFCTEVLLLDNGSTEESVSQGIAFWKGLNILPIRVVKLVDNVGFVGGANIGIERASGDSVLLLSNDVRIFNDLPFKMCANLKDKQLLGGKYWHNDTGWNTFNGKTYPYMEGWCLGATKESWEELGGFDDRYAPSDFEDVDLSQTARLLGYDFIEIPVNSMQHRGGGTYEYTEERRARTIRNQQLFKEKWKIE